MSLPRGRRLKNWLRDPETPVPKRIVKKQKRFSSNAVVVLSSSESEEEILRQAEGSFTLEGDGASAENFAGMRYDPTNAEGFENLCSDWEDIDDDFENTDDDLFDRKSLSDSLIDSDSDILSSDEGSNCSEDLGFELHHDKLKRKVYASSKFTVAEFLLDVTKLFRTFKISKNCVIAILRLCRKHFPSGNYVPNSKKAFMTIIARLTPFLKSCVKYHCAECGLCVGTKKLRKCNQIHCKSTNFSVTLENNIENILRHFFENRNLFEKVDSFRDQTINDDKIRDISDGLNCKEVVNQSSYDLRLMHNCDGFPMGNSTTMQIWPNFLAIVDIHHKLRPSFMMLTSIYCGSSKPNFDAYLKDWSTQLAKIGQSGINWKNPKTNVDEHSRAYVCVSAVDAQARAPLQNITYYNGAYGCTYCEIKSEPLKDDLNEDVATKDTYTNVCYYPYKLSLDAPLRTKKSVMENAAQVVELTNQGEIPKPIKGVKGFSYLAFLPHFDIARGFSPDLLHSCLLGVVRRHLNNLFNSRYKDKGFHLTAGMKNLISSRLVKIKPPNMVTRLPRSLKYLKQWKGSEFLWWVLYYSLPCLDKTFSNPNYLEHYMILVRAIHSLLEDSISNEEIEYCKTILNMFCSAYGELYDPQEETFNLHMLLHYADSVKNCGPLWASSTMMFESANNFLKNSIHGSNNVAKELENTSKIYAAIDILQMMCSSESEQEKINITLLGFRKSFEELPIEIRDFIIASISNAKESSSLEVFQRARVNGITFTTESYKKAKKTCSYYALVKNTFSGTKEIEFVKLVAFVNTLSGKFFIGKIVKVFGPAYKSVRFGVEVKHIRLSLDTNNLVYSNLENIVKPLLKIEDKICIPPKIWCTNF